MNDIAVCGLAAAKGRNSSDEGRRLHLQISISTALHDVGDCFQGLSLCQPALQQLAGYRTVTLSPGTNLTTRGMEMLERITRPHGSLLLSRCQRFEASIPKPGVREGDHNGSCLHTQRQAQVGIVQADSFNFLLGEKWTGARWSTRPHRRRVRGTPPAMHHGRCGEAADDATP